MKKNDVIRKMIIMLVVFMALFVSGCITYESDSVSSSSESLANAEFQSADFIKIPVSYVTDTMKKYTLNVGGVSVVYFTVVGSDGVIRTAFDACDVCGGSKGYRQDGTDVVCNNCGKYFAIDDIGSKNGPGGCWPSFLDHKVEDGFVVINEKDVADGAFRFR
ncbi:MAG: DUF2318 domain-containing protein [DPANN group archaeon]|nr:DUF2318 domain-containing protein [DPANN group archaeon]